MLSKSLLHVSLVGMLTSGYAFGCGDDGDEPNTGDGASAGQCDGTFTPCGGDLVGAWTITGACLTLPTGIAPGTQGASDPYAACTTKPSSDVSIEVIGTATFRADGTYQSDQTVTVGAETVVTNACLATVGTGKLTCAAVMGQIVADTCVVTQAPETTINSSAGSYSIQGHKLSIVSADPEDSDSDEVTQYCVKGSTLTVRTQTSNGAIMQYSARRK